MLAASVATLTGRKTILDTDMEALETLGYGFKEVIEPKYDKK